jgi:serine/threonine protein phosphatase 1
MNRTIVIGDVHGGLKALHQVFERANITTTDKLIFLGDYVDGWSESAGVIDYLLELDKTNNCIFLKGNHDEWCEEWLRSGNANGTWLAHGGEETVTSYFAAATEARSWHLIFLEQLPYYFIDEKKRLFVHAGFTSNQGPQKEPNLSDLNRDRTLWDLAVTMHLREKPGSLFFPKKLSRFKEIYIGHTPTLYYDEDVPMQSCNVWNIDTGAAFTGKLSIIDVDTKQYWQSDPVYKLYPDEKGRNKQDD